MTVSQGRVVRDGRRLPYFAITKAAMRSLRAAFEGGKRKTAIAVYATLVEASNDEGSDSFTATRARIAARAGVHPSTLTEYADLLAEAGLLSIERRREGAANLPNLWTLTDPPLLASGEEGSSPQARRGARLRRGPSSPQATEAVASGEEGSSSQTTRLEEPVEEQEPAADAAASRAHAPRAGAPAHDAGPAAGTGSSSTGTPVEVSDFWDRAAAALEVAGFAGKVIGSARLQILDRLRRSHIPLGDIVWPLLGPQLKIWREDPGVIATKPDELLAFALQQRGDVVFTTTSRPRPSGAAPGRPTSSAPTAAAAQNAAVNDRLVLPESAEDAAGAWRDVVDGLEALPNWEEIERAIGSGVVSSVHPLRLVGNVLEISAAQAGAYLVEHRLLNVADRYARERLNGHVRWVPRDEAAAQAPGRAAA